MIKKWSGLLEPGAQPPVDLLPILKYVPSRWAQWKGLCSEIRANQYDLYEGLVAQCERRMERNMRNGCFLESVLDDKKLGADRTLIRCVLQLFYIRCVEFLLTSWQCDTEALLAHSLREGLIQQHCSCEA